MPIGQLDVDADTGEVLTSAETAEAMIDRGRQLTLPHKLQQGDGYCLPACVQMVFGYLGIAHTQAAIAKTLGLNPPLGTVIRISLNWPQPGSR